MAGSKIRLPFGVDPAPPYQMLYFHYRQGVKKRLYERQHEKTERNKLISSLNINIRKLINLPGNFSIIVMPSEYYLIPFFIRENNSILTFNSGYKGVFEKITCEQVNLIDLKSAGTDENISGDLFISDTDIYTGYFINDKAISDVSVIKGGKDFHIDMSASLLSRSFDFDLYPSIFFNTKFMFGFYPGILVWMLKNDQLVKYLTGTGYSEAFYTSVSDCYCHQDVDLLDIYVLSGITGDMSQRGSQIIRNEMIYKSILIYQAFERSKNFELLVAEESNRSSSIICARSLISEQQTHDFFDKGSIHVNYHHTGEKGLTVQIGNFPVHSKEQAGYLADIVEKD